MPQVNQQRDRANLQIQLITTILKLVKLDTPVVAVWYHENDLKTFGSKHLKEFISSLDQAALSNAIKSDVLNLGSPEPDEPLNEMTEGSIPEKIKAKQIFQQFCSEKDPEKLPFPLSCLNRKEKIAWLTREILQDQREQSGDMFCTVRYGEANLRPSFWPNDEWDWTLLSKNLSNVTKEMYTGPGQFLDFLTKLIERCLSMKGKDPEKYFPDNINQKALKRRRKMHGIHDGSHIVEEPNLEDLSDFEEEQFIPESEYRFPAPVSDALPTNADQNVNSPFIPRRRMPDDGCSPIGPPPPCATPVHLEETSEVQQPPSVLPSPPPPPSAGCPSQSTDSDLSLYPSQISQPDLTNDSFEYSWSSRDIVCPPIFLANMQYPLHPGWKCLENPGTGGCLFMAGADHIGL